MTPIEILALILIAITAIKTVVNLAAPKSRAKVVKKVSKNPTILYILFLVLAAIVLYFLIQEITIVEILAVTLFVTLLMAIMFIPYFGELGNLAEKISLKKAWLGILIWLILMIWALYVMFA